MYKFIPLNISNDYIKFFVNNIIIYNIIMPSLKSFFLNWLHDDYRKYNCFIETGTHNGGTIFELEPYFNKLYTI